jgi:hypothetical protein
MQDGANPYFANVCTCLHVHLPGRWIGRRGLHE